MNKNNFLKYFSHYLPLAGMLAIAAAAFYYFSYEKMFLLGASIAISIAYIFWGLVHHMIHRDLNTKVIFEYVAVALLGLIILVSVIFWM